MQIRVREVHVWTADAADFQPGFPELSRLVLSRYCGQRPEDLQFRYSSWGKPVVVCGSGRPIFHSLSHSGTKAAVAISAPDDVGIDIELKRPGRRFHDIVEYAFSRDENEEFSRSPEHSVCDTFYTLWTRKEALIKAAGASVAVHMDRARVSGPPNESGWAPAFIVHENRLWFVRTLDLFRGYAGALCVRSNDVKVVVRSLTPLDRVP